MSFPANPTPPTNPRNEEKRNPKNDDVDNDPWSLLIAVVSGIPIRLHFTFLLLILYLALAPIVTGGTGGGRNVLIVLGVFFCVILHELGHAITAQRFGYGVRDIVLYPIGGVAALEDSPRARHELWIALAGPAVNVVIAILLAIALSFQPGGLSDVQWSPFATRLNTNPVSLLLTVNIWLVLFNMLPAFPMDGGRVLRALLALRMPRERATRIAAVLGQAIAICLGIFGFYHQQFSYVLIALFVFFGAGQEAQGEETREVVNDARVSEAMVHDFKTLTNGDSLRHATTVLLATSQQDFPVVVGSDVLGILSRSALLRGLAQSGESAYVAEVMERNVLFALPDDSLEEYMLRPDGVNRAPVLVRDAEGNLVGMLTLENLMEFLTVRRVLRGRIAAAA